MTRECISEALGFVDTKYILEAMAAETGASGKSRRADRLLRTLLAAAAVAAVLAATALAVYHYRVQDAVMELPHYNIMTDSIEPRAGLSLNGFRDSPEYQAFAEWYAWREQDRKERPNRFAELGVDDSYYETPANYAHLYDAPFADQAAALDEIAARYGLYLHERREIFETQSQLCAILGLEGLLDEPFDACSGYIYDDGSFHAEGLLAASAPAEAYGLTVTAKGSFVQAWSNLAEDYEEWNFVTPEGRELLVCKAQDGARVLAELEGAYVSLGLQGSMEREALETLVLALDWEALAGRFDGHISREETTAALEAWLEARTQMTVTDNMEEETALVLSILGNFTIGELPEGYYLWRSTSEAPFQWQEEDGKGWFSLTHSYSSDTGAGLGLRWRTLNEGDEGRELDTYLKNEQVLLMESTMTNVQVQGWEAVLAMQEDAGRSSGQIWWLDEERELLFWLHAGGTAEELLAMAESVMPVGEEVSPAERSRRMAAAQESFDALEQEQNAARDAKAEREQQELEAIAAKVGRYDFGALPEDFSFDYEYGDTAAAWDWFSGEDIGTETILRRLYYSDEGEGLMLASHLCENDEGLCHRAVFEARRKQADYQLRENTGDVEEFGEIRVNGHEAYYTVSSMDSVYIPEGGTEPVETVFRQAILVWLDEEEERLFGMNYNCTGREPRFTTEELIALAESVGPME